MIGDLRLRTRSASVLGVLAFTLAACAPPHLIYSMNPVDRGGVALELGRVTAVEFEDGSVLRLQAGERVRIEQGALVLELPPDQAPEGQPTRWQVSQVSRIRWTDPRGKTRLSDVLSPDDLLAYDELPRLSRVEMVDGTVRTIDETNEYSRWNENGLELELSEDGEEFESFPLAQIETIRLHRSSLTDATVKSKGFWIVGAGAAALLWFIVNQTDTDNLATR